MTDLEKVRLCAEAIDLGCYEVTDNRPEHTIRLNGTGSKSYWPLTNDQQAMDLVKGVKLDLNFDEDRWFVIANTPPYQSAVNVNLNRAIVECVAAIRGGTKP